MIASLSDNVSASSIECVVKITVLSVFERKITSQIFRRLIGSKPVEISSRSKIGGFPTSAKHNVNLRLMPPDNEREITFVDASNATSCSLIRVNFYNASLSVNVFRSAAASPSTVSSFTSFSSSSSPSSTGAIPARYAAQRAYLIDSTSSWYRSPRKSAKILMCSAGVKSGHKMSN